MPAKVSVAAGNVYVALLELTAAIKVVLPVVIPEALKPITLVASVASAAIAPTLIAAIVIVEAAVYVTKYLATPFAGITVIADTVTPAPPVIVATASVLFL